MAPVKVALVGPRAWLEVSRPATQRRDLLLGFFPADERDGPLASVRDFRPDVSVVLDPLGVNEELLRALPGLTLGLLVGSALPSPELAGALDVLDRIASFRPALTGQKVGASTVWRAVPPPVADQFFAPARPLHHSPRAMSIGRSTAHREKMLMPAKHHHDLLQALHGVEGETLAAMLARHDVAVYVPPDGHSGFGVQVGLHLAAGQLLLSAPLSPQHGLERDIDYLQFDTPEGLVWMLDRLGRFPEMHQRVRVRGRLKAEQYRASRVFRRIVEDLLADVRAFGRRPPVVVDDDQRRR